MPELAASFLVGATLAFLASVCFTYFQLAKYRSDGYLKLQNNLSKINLRWNDLEGSVEPFDSNANSIEIKKVKNTCLLFGIASVIFRWVGLFFLILMWVSLKKLVKNRLEMHLFRSDLAKAEQVQSDINQFWQQTKDLGLS